jgi:dsDNA-binding SOS-regulon protein
MTPEERRRLRLARTGPLSSGIPNPIFRNYPEIGMPISDKAWYEIPPAMSYPNDSRYGTIEGYREGRDPSTGEPIFPSRDQIVLDYLQSKRPTSTPTSVGGGYDPFGVVPPTSVGGGYDPIGFVPTTSVGGGWDLFPEGQPSTVSSIPTLDESYSVAGRDIQSEVADEINETIRLQALSAEEWEREKLKLIQSDNKMELAVALLTGTAPNLTSVASATSGPAASATATAQNNLEKSKLTQEWLKNPPTTQDQIIEFGSRFNASPSGWAFIKSMKPMFDWGDVIEWKKLMPDGTVDYKYARKGDVKRNALLRGENFRTGSLADDRAVVADQKFSEASSELSSFLGNRILTQELLNEFMQQNKSLLLDPKKVAAISTLAKMYDLKPSYDTFTVIGKGYKVGDEEMPIGYQFPVRVGSDIWKKAVENPALQNLSESDAYQININKIHKSENEKIYNDIESMISDGKILNNDFVIKEEIKRLGAEAQGTAFGYVFDPEKDTETIFNRLGRGTESALYKELIDDYYNTLIQAKTETGEDKYDQEEIRELLLAFANSPGLNIPEEHINKLIEQAGVIRTPQTYSDTITIPERTEIRWVGKGDNRRMVVVTIPASTAVRTGDATAEEIKVGDSSIVSEEVEPTTRGHRYIDKVDNIGKEIINEETMQGEQGNVKEIVTELVRDPEGFAKARDSYSQMWKALDLAGDDPTKWGTIDKVIGEIFKKLRDTSMITEGEFEALKRTTGVWDRWGNFIRTAGTGESFTGDQKRAILEAAHTWFLAKQSGLLEQINPYRTSFNARYPKATTTLPPGYSLDDVFNMAGVPMEWIESEVKKPQELFDRYPEYFKVIEGEDGADDDFDASTTLDELDKRHGGVKLVPENRVRRGN